jgi:hypothetical protein
MRAVSLLVVVAATFALAQSDAGWPKSLPELKLDDPLGNTFTEDNFTERGVVVVATAPSLSQGDAQQTWDAAFRGARRGADGPQVVMLEDMSQSWFRGPVLDRMRASYKSGQTLVLLLDEDGAIRKALGVPENATVAFAFAPGGQLAAVETQGGTVERARKLLKAAAQPGPGHR